MEKLVGEEKSLVYTDTSAFGSVFHSRLTSIYIQEIIQTENCVDKAREPYF